MIDVIFYNFEKRQNSTKRPLEGTTIPCLLKESTDVLAPVIELHSAGFPDFNYAKIPAFNNRYYYIEAKSYEQGGRWTLTLSVDSLGSWKDAILSKSANVEYSSSDFDVNITDTRLAVNNVKWYEKVTTESSSLLFNRTGCYILSTISVDANGQNGAVASYALTASTMAELSAYLFAEDTLTNIWQSVRDTFQNPMECIMSCKWIPIPYADITGTNGSIHLTYIDTGIVTKVISGTTINSTFTVPLHPADSEVADNFLQLSPYTQGILYLPFVGYVPLDIDAYYDSSFYSVSVHIDITTGDVVYDLGNRVRLNTSSYAGNCAVNIPLSRNMIDVGSALISTVSTIGGVVSGEVKEAFGSAVGMLKSAQIHTQTNGSISSRAGIQMSLDIIHYLIHSETTEDFDSAERIALMGLPCMKTVALSTLSGFVKCSNYSASGSYMLPAEANEINAAINGSGIYIE